MDCQRPSQPLLPRHGWAALPPRVITALPPTHTQEMKYSSRTYWLLQRLLGKVNETGWGKEMSVRPRWWGGSRGQGWAATSSWASLGFSSWKSTAPSVLGAPNNLHLLTNCRTSRSSGRWRPGSFTFQFLGSTAKSKSIPPTASLSLCCPRGLTGQAGQW